jgi:hypothetical protein
MKIKKIIATSQDYLFRILKHYCNPNLQINDIKSQVLIGLVLPADLRSRGEDLASWMDWPLYSHTHQIMSLNAEYSENTTVSGNHIDLSSLAAAKSATKASTIITSAIQDKLARVLSQPHKDIDTAKPIYTYSVDSLVAVELRN